MVKNKPSVQVCPSSVQQLSVEVPIRPSAAVRKNDITSQLTHVQFYCSAMYTLQLLCLVSVSGLFFSNNLIKSYMPA